MLSPTPVLLRDATRNGYAIGAFNVYNLEGALAVAAAAEKAHSPAMLQVLPSALVQGGAVLIELCLAVAAWASVPMAVQLDHCSDPSVIDLALNAGVSSVMVDGSPLPFRENVAFTQQMAKRAERSGCDG